MDVDVPYMQSVGNLHKILDKIQNAGAPEAFGLDFLKDLGFTSSNDRSVIKLLKYLGFLDAGGKPQTSYREFMDNSKAKGVLAARLRSAYDDLFLSDKDAQTQSSVQLKGWFKTKTGVGDAVAEKMASTFRSLASYADFSGPASQPQIKPSDEKQPEESAGKKDKNPIPPKASSEQLTISQGLGFVYRIEIHLPDTTNIDTYRAIFRAVREELAL